MFTVFKTVHPPTGIDCSVYCNFLSAKEQNLITASGSKLQVYRFNVDPNSKANKLKLECFETFNFYGTICCMKSCRYGLMQKDALVLAFSDAKVSIVEYDSFLGDLVTLSIHYFENELESEGLQYNIYKPILKIDPNMRCAVMLIYGYKLAVIPFYEENNRNFAIAHESEAKLPSENHQTTFGSYFKSESADSNLDSRQPFFQQPIKIETRNKNQSSYMIDLRKLDACLEMRIIDIEFLYGYYEPTLFVLCESTMTWVGRYAVKRDTCNSVALSLNLNQRTHPIIWPVEKLPSDCLRCYAVPPPIGGMLLFALNSLIYINQSVPSYGVTLNSIAKLTSSYPFRNMEHVKITLDNSQGVFVAPDRMIVSLKGGELCLITLLTDSESLRSVRNFSIEKGPGSVISSCITKCSENYVFVGSRLANSVLLKYTAKSSQKNLPNQINEKIDQSLGQTSNNNLVELEYDQPKNENNNNDKEANDADHNLNQNDERQLDELDKLMNIMEQSDENKLDVVSYSFEICDILLNIGPCGNSIIGESTGDYSEFEIDSNNRTQLIDIVTSSGFTKNGSISVLQRSLRPDLIATFPIPDIIDMWSLANDSEQSPYSPTYLFLSKSNSTVILQIANEITELDKENTTFCTKSATIYCTNILNNKYILQVTTSCVYLYCECLLAEQGPKLAYLLDLADKIDSRIKNALTIDLYLVVLSEKGTIYMLKFDEHENAFAQIDKISESNFFFSNVCCFTLYKDDSNIFTTLTLDNDAQQQQQLANKATVSVNKPAEFDSDARVTPMANESSLFALQDMNVDDEEELLYGSGESAMDKNGGASSTFNQTEASSAYINKLLTNSGVKSYLNLSATKPKTTPVEAPINESSSTFNKPTPKIRKTTYWLLTVNFDGILNIIYLNGDKFNLIYSIPKFNQAPKTIIPVNNYKFVPLETQESVSSIMRTSSIIETNQIIVSELLLTSAGFDKNRPLLIAKMDEDLIIYEAFLTTTNRRESSIKQLNFRRVNHEILVRDKRKRKNQFRKNAELVQNTEHSILDPDYFSTRTQFSPTLKAFSNIANFSGFFVSGSYPYMVFFCPRSGLTSHPLWLDGAVTSFCPLKNSSITLSGFIYINKNSNVRISTLPLDDANGRLQIHYDSSWMLKKVQIRQTVHFICYHEESKTYAVVATLTEPINKLVHLGEEDKEVVIIEKDENFPLPNRSQFYFQLYTSSTWEPLPLGKYDLAEWEHVTSLKLVSLPYEGHSSGFRSYLATSTINCYTEDVNSRGRIIILDVVETVPDPDKPLTNIKIKIILEKEQKGPVTCLESVEGYLIGCIGQKVFIWEYQNNELIGKAFIDTHFYIHKMVALKNFVLVADIHQSLTLIRFQKEYTKLSFVAKDKQIVDAYTCDYLVDNSNLAFIGSDSERNLNIYMYQSESHDNQGGQWLIRRAEFHVGYHVNSMFRLKCKVNDPNLDKRSNLADKRQVTYCTNLDGGISYVIPISEKTFRRLFILQNAMYVMKQHYGGLNPKMFRIRKGKRTELCNPQKNTLDGDLLFEYLNLSYPDRNEISKKIKTNMDQLLDDLTEIFQFTCHF